MGVMTTKAISECMHGLKTDYDYVQMTYALAPNWFQALLKY
jgi:hypothetical protein